MREIDQQREFYESAKPENVQKFLENGFRDQAEALARSGIVPGLSIINLEAGDVKDENAIAKNVFPKIKVEDPHYLKADPTTPEGFTEGAILATAELIAAKREVTNPEVKSRLEKTANKVLYAAIDAATSKLPRRTFLKLATGVGATLVLAACSPTVIGPVVPIDGNTPTSVVPTETFTPTETATATEEVSNGSYLTQADLEKNSWCGRTITENAKGYFEIEGFPEVKFFEDGTAERTVRFKGENKVTTVAFQAISIGENGESIFGLWEYSNEVWSEAITSSAPGSVENTENFHKLVILGGHEKEQAMIDTVSYANQAVNHAGEFDRITITYNFKNYENFDVRPKEWRIKNWTRNRPGEFILVPIPINNEVPYDYSPSSTSHGRPMLVALGTELQPEAGWFKIEAHNEDGTLQPEILHIPVVAMNSDRSLVNMSALLRLTELGKITHLLTTDARGQIYFGLHKESMRDDYPEMLTDKDLISLTIEVNQEYFDKVGTPELDNPQVFKSLPKDLERVFLILKVRPETQKQ